MVMPPCGIHHLNRLDFNKISVRPSTNLYKGQTIEMSHTDLQIHILIEIITIGLKLDGNS